MARTVLRDLLRQSKSCVVAPCVYDCASARAVELVGFKAIMLSGGELSLAMNGVVDYGFTNLTDIEWMVSRLSQSSPLALAVDIEDGFGGPLAVPASGWHGPAPRRYSLKIPATWKSPRCFFPGSSITPRSKPPLPR